MTWRVAHGGCIAVMAAMPAGSVDAIVTDPPYGLGFMGRSWDALPPGLQWAQVCLRVLKPGGHLLAFGGTRTSHRLVCAIEDAGFEIRDTIAWMYGSGFPKSLDVSKAIDKAAGAERVGAPRSTAPATPDAERWQGWGTALKPAFEPIVVARKPLAGTVAANVLAHGTGALNVDGCRIEHGDDVDLAAVQRQGAAPNPNTVGWMKPGDVVEMYKPGGRWPANVALDEDAAALLDEQTGELHSGANPTRRGSDKFRTAYGDFEGQRECEPARGAESGGASRFFYCAKADSAERNAGLGADAGLFATGDEPDRNDHPTVKPIALMRWLVRLVTPPRGVVLDPFCGSGTTGCATVLEGFNFIGIERDAAYVAICKARLTYWSAGQPTT